MGSGDEGPAKGGWLTSLPGILSGVAALIGAISGVVVLLRPSSDKAAVDPPKPQPFYVTSYDCNSATSKVSLLICHDATLAQLDVKLGEQYASLLSELAGANSSALDKLKVDQTLWLHKREACADQSQDFQVYNCVKEDFTQRIAELENYPRPTAPASTSVSAPSAAVTQSASSSPSPVKKLSQPAHKK
jgi:uncharacterized protein YecT (DUF1311 family)